jgi:hypothetical protein
MLNNLMQGCYGIFNLVRNPFKKRRRRRRDVGIPQSEVPRHPSLAEDIELLAHEWSSLLIQYVS